MTVTTKIATSNATSITVRGHDLTKLIGELSFTEMIWLQMLGTRATAAQVAVVDACLVALIEHGLTPSAIAARMIYGSAPEAMQGAVAAGLLGVGGQFVGTAEGCAKLLARIVGGATPEAILAEHKTLPGFGHDIHKPDDPRTAKLLAVARAHGLAGAHVRALEALSAALDRAKGKHITVNATGAVAALLLDAGAPPEVLRGFALIARCAGLVGHVHEEQLSPAMRSIWVAAEQAVPYEKP